MQSLNISLPEPLKEFVDGQIAAGRYSSASEYVCELIRADEKRKGRSASRDVAPRGAAECRNGIDSGRLE
jgi:putative addiction module CopG family antidote